MGSLSVACCSSFDAPSPRREACQPRYPRKAFIPLRRSSTPVRRAILGPSASPFAVAARLCPAFPLTGLNCSVCRLGRPPACRAVHTWVCIIVPSNMKTVAAPLTFTNRLLSLAHIGTWTPAGRRPQLTQSSWPISCIEN
jgi:hypothetical protein